MAKKKKINQKEKVKKGRRIHAKKRAYQRYRLNYNQKARKEMLESINSNNSRAIKKQTCSKTIHVVEYGGKEYPVVYSKTSNEILTFLQKDWL